MPARQLGAAATLLALVLAPLVIPAYELSLLGRFLAFAILALGIALVWGTAGILSLGQGLFFALGGYAVAMYLKLATLAPGEMPDFMQWSGLTELPAWWAPFHSPVVAFAAVLLVPGAAAGAIAFLVFRRRIGGAYFALITQALVLAASTFIISQQAYTGGFNGLTNFDRILGLPLGDPHTQLILYFVTLGLLALAFGLTAWLRASQFGKVLLAVRDGENRVRFLGYDPLPFKVAAFAFAGLLAGISGALVTLHIGVISPAMFGVVPSIEMLIWVAVGGRESLFGAVLGTLLVNFGKDVISSKFPSAWLFVMGALFVLVVTVAPTGIAGLLARLRRPQFTPAPPPVPSTEAVQ
jgi:urea transport system permease protein